MMKYLTRPKDPKKIAKVEREDKYIVDGSKGTIRSEREINEDRDWETTSSFDYTP